MKVIFYRILGNDIPPRHSPDQTVTNLAFILANEPEFPGAEKRFMINRILDRDTRNRLIAMIDEAGLKWHEIEFNDNDFLKFNNFYERSLYVTNQNGARNLCLKLGMQDADIVLPFDGQMFFTAEGWSKMINDLKKIPPDCKYFMVPMFRLQNNKQVLKPLPELRAEVEKDGPAEPQVGFCKGFDIRFNETLTYGFANKVELLMRLGINGAWDQSAHPLYDLVRANIAKQRSQSFGKVRNAGFIFRLESGNGQADKDVSVRIQTRDDGLQQFVSQIEQSINTKLRA